MAYLLQLPQRHIVSGHYILTSSKASLKNMSEHLKKTWVQTFSCGVLMHVPVDLRDLYFNCWAWLQKPVLRPTCSLCPGVAAFTTSELHMAIKVAFSAIESFPTLGALHFCMRLPLSSFQVELTKALHAWVFFTTPYWKSLEYDYLTMSGPALEYKNTKMHWRPTLLCHSKNQLWTIQPCQGKQTSVQLHAVQVLQWVDL